MGSPSCGSNCRKTVTTASASRGVPLMKSESFGARLTRGITSGASSAHAADRGSKTEQAKTAAASNWWHQNGKVNLQPIRETCMIPILRAKSARITAHESSQSPTLPALVAAINPELSSRQVQLQCDAHYLFSRTAFRWQKMLFTFHSERDSVPFSRVANLLLPNES
jgi:hypothetical protein